MSTDRTAVGTHAGDGGFARRLIYCLSTTYLPSICNNGRPNKPCPNGWTFRVIVSSQNPFFWRQVASYWPLTGIRWTRTLLFPPLVRCRPWRLWRSRTICPGICPGGCRRMDTGLGDHRPLRYACTIKLECRLPRVRRKRRGGLGTKTNSRPTRNSYTLFIFDNKITPEPHWFRARFRPRFTSGLVARNAES